MARGSNSRNGRTARSELGTVLSAKFANDRSLEARVIAEGKEDYNRASEMDAELMKVRNDAATYDYDYLNNTFKDLSDAHDALTDFIKENLDPEKVKNDPTFAKYTPKQISESNADLRYLLKDGAEDRHDELVEEERRAGLYAERVQDEMENPAINWQQAFADLRGEIGEFQDYSSIDTFYGGAASGVRPYTRNIVSVANKMIEYGRRHGETAGEISSDFIKGAVREVEEASKEIGRLRSDMEILKENDEKDEVKIAGTYARHQEATRRYIDNAMDIVRIAIEQRDLYNGLRRYDNRPMRGDED